jgi:riboflavin kinase/FMN adenylyltransferase
VKRLGAIDELPAGLRFVLAIGMFDGVHRGHQRLLRTLTKVAREREAKAVVMTFEPHPAAVLRGNAPPLLCDPAEKMARLAELGVDMVVEQRFDPHFAEQTAESFLARACSSREMVALVMTEESAFGRDRSGGLPEIRRLGPRLGLEVIEVAHLTGASARVSSTRLRKLLAEGRLAEVRRMLGRPYAVIGRVVQGDRRGRTLGYPTANLAFAQEVALPPDGIYAVRVGWAGRDPISPQRNVDGVASLGVRPTFDSDGARLLEVNLFEVDEELYGRSLRIEFVRRLRGERKFASAEALVRQMDRDAARARAILTNHRQPLAGGQRAPSANAC